MTPGQTRLLLGSLYFVQGLPFGYQARVLPAVLAERGTSLAAIGLVGALAAPWVLKALWAPLVDRWWSPRLGRRRSWIIPLTTLLIAACGVGALVHESVPALCGLVLVMNLLAATQDIAVDGLAVDLLGEADLGPGNAIQYVGYRLGMVASGGLLLWALPLTGGAGQFLLMGALGLPALVAVGLWREPPPPAPAGAGGPTATLGDIAATLLAAARRPGGAWLLLFVGTYRAGESLIDAMFTPFLIRVGVSVGAYGLWVGTYGVAAAIAGSLAGGWLARWWRLDAVLGLALVLRCGPLGSWAVLAAEPAPAHGQLFAVMLAEHALSGALTTAMFAFMMSRVDRTIGASHYALLACVEVLGKSPGAWASGLLAERLGFVGVFSLGAALSLLVVPLLGPAFRAGAGAPADAAPVDAARPEGAA